jgi:asparagine synthase (glutamine-hydrolysing)
VTIVWAAADTTPIACQAGNDGSDSFFDMGEPWLDYHLRCQIAGHGQVSLTTDPLGLFPLYHATASDRLYFSTSPGLIRDIADRGFEPSAVGIAGVLLAGFMLDGQTIWQGIRRLPPGSILNWSPGHGVSIRAEGSILASDRYFGASDEQCLEAIDSSLEQAIARRVRGRPVSMMLSGGLDSRILAGYLYASGARDTSAVIFGRRSDYDMIFASLVARSLGWSISRQEDNALRYPDVARRQVDLEQMSNSLANLSWWTGTSTFRRLGRPVLNGFLGDVVMGGGTSLVEAFDPATGDYPFERVFGLDNRYGLSPAAARAFMQAGFFGDAVSQVIEAVRSTYDSLPGQGFQKAWRFNLEHRQRFHIAPLAWRMAFEAWPLLPYVDQDLLQTMAGMPLRLMKDRAAQRSFLRTRFPELARLPLDTSSRTPELLIGSVPGRLTARIATSRLIDRFVARCGERRHYYRAYDLDSPGWMSVRQLAEPHRSSLAAMFDPQQLEQLLPPPAVRLGLTDPTVQAGVTRSLLGLMLLRVTGSCRDLVKEP